ncbi:MAG: sirohydrochlorin chelatase [Synechococcales bacterium]|nr:sirohydrochlorin chelatase [Synechococcales bacterium]
MKHFPHRDLDSRSAAYLLVTHGSRDPRPDWAAHQLADRVAKRLIALTAAAIPDPPHPLVGTATLELAEEPLHRQIERFGDRAQSLGMHQVAIVPLFLLPGVHVRDDLPREVAVAQQSLGGRVALHLTPYLGSHPAMGGYLRHCLDDFSEESQWADGQPAKIGRIVMAHGSRRPGGNQLIEAIAHQLDAEPAYWFVAPSLPDQVQTLVQRGCRQIRIMPYFLFAGGITDAIAEMVCQVSAQHPDLALLLQAPLGPTPAIAEMVVDLLTQVEFPAAATSIF